VAFECLEDRTLLTAVPFGAAPDDTAEFMLGDVLVTVVLMESHGATTSINPNTEDWTVNAIEEVQRKVVEGLGWWEETLAVTHPDAPHALNFQYDWTYAGGKFQDANPEDVVLTTYEPIANESDKFEDWIYDFLGSVGYNATGVFGSDIRAFNHAQRQTHNTEWAFTIFAVNDENDPEYTPEAGGTFSSQGSFSRAFAYPGGQFFVTPAGRPPSTYAHETGHIFWARDEYRTLYGSHTDRRGYYDAQNWNYAGNPTAGFVQDDSIMANGTYMSVAWGTHISSQSSREMVGWRDSDGDGIFDLLDVPHTLTGSGYVDTQTGDYRFVGTSAVETLINENSSGLQNDITINEISRAEYRIDPVDADDEWVALTEGVTGDFVANLDLRIPLPDANSHVIEIRTVDDESGVTSPVFQGDTTTATSFLQQGINGFVWNDIDGNSQIDPGEPGLSGWTVRLVDAEGEPSDVDAVEPDDFGQHAPLNHPKVTLTTALGDEVVAKVAYPASTGNRVFAHKASSSSVDVTWDSVSNHLRMDFSSPVAAIRLDAVGKGNSYGRLEAYNAADMLVERYTTGQLGLGDVETMTISRSRPDITYAIARGHMGSEVNLDNLRFGPEIETLTNGSGAYSLTNLSAGTYYVQAESPGSQDPLSQQHETTLAEGEATGDVNFDGKAASWRNPGTPSDVNNDGIVSPLDALLVIAYINSHPDDSSVPPAPAEPPPYYDVDGNGIVSGLDVLTIISTLNGEVGGSPESEPAYVSRGVGEGESAPAKPPASTPFLATAEHVAPLPQPETLSSTTPPRQEEATNHRDLWRTAADVYFRQVRSAERESRVAARQTNELDADLDQILPEIALDIAQLSEGAVVV